MFMSFRPVGYQSKTLKRREEGREWPLEGGGTKERAARVGKVLVEDGKQ